MVFEAVLSIDVVLSINPSACIWRWRLKFLHKHWLNYSGGTDRLGELCYNITIFNDFTQLVNVPTRIPLAVTLTVLLFCISFFLLTLVFVLL